MRQAIAEENLKIAEARKRFWETYPDKPGSAEARDEFGQRLYGKDFHYLYIRLTDALGGVKTIDTVGGKLDGGIPAYAGFEFRDWVEEILSNLGERSLTDALLNNFSEAWKLPERLEKAMAASERKHEIYLFERDWAEFDAVGREPAGLEDPALYFPALCIRSQKIDWDDALAEFDGIVKALGRDNVLQAIQQVHAAPRERFGVLKVTTSDPVKIGPGGSKVEDDTIPEAEGVIGVTAGAIRAVERLATQGDDRRYLLWLLTEENRPGLGSHIEQPTKWQYAETTYRRLVVAFGEQDVLQASHQVRTATKRATSGDVMDPKAIGATRGVPFASFEDVLARGNPRGYARAALIFSEQLETPAEVDAAYGKRVAASSEDAVLEAARKLAAARPNLVHPGEIQLLENAVRAPPASATPAETLVDFPEYLAWKRFAPGAKVTYESRLWMPDQYGSDHLVPGPPKTLQAYLLQSIDADQAKLWQTITTFDRNGAPHDPRDTEIAYPARYQPPTVSRGPPAASAATSLVPASNLAIGAEPNSAPIESGAETIEVGGQRIATRWQSASSRYTASSEDKDCRLVVKVWISDAIPSGLVRKTEEKTCPASQGRPGNRIIFETYLKSFEGFTPAVGDASKAVTGK